MDYGSNQLIKQRSSIMLLKRQSKLHNSININRNSRTSILHQSQFNNEKSPIKKQQINRNSILGNQDIDEVTSPSRPIKQRQQVIEALKNIRKWSYVRKDEDLFQIIEPLPIEDVYEQAIEIVSKIPLQRTVEEIILLHMLVQKIDFFKKIYTYQGRDIIHKLLQQSQHRYVKAGQHVYREGQPGNFFCLILKGSLVVKKKLEKSDSSKNMMQNIRYKTNELYQQQSKFIQQEFYDTDQQKDDYNEKQKDDQQQQQLQQSQQNLMENKNTFKKIQDISKALNSALIVTRKQNPNDILKQGSNLGQDFLIKGSMGTSKNNILSLENCHLLIIERQQYEDIMREKESKVIQQAIEQFSKINLMTGLSLTIRKALYLKSKEINLTRNKFVFQENDPVQHVYFIKEGEITIKKKIKLEQIDEKKRNQDNSFNSNGNQNSRRDELLKHMKKYNQQEILQFDMALLGSGESIGVEDAINKSPLRTSTAIVYSTNATLYQVRKDDFLYYIHLDEQNKNFEQLNQEISRKQVWRNNILDGLKKVNHRITKSLSIQQQQSINNQFEIDHNGNSNIDNQKIIVKDKEFINHESIQIKNIQQNKHKQQHNFDFIMSYIDQIKSKKFHRGQKKEIITNLIDWTINQMHSKQIYKELSSCPQSSRLDIPFQKTFQQENIISLQNSTNQLKSTNEKQESQNYLQEPQFGKSSIQFSKPKLIHTIVHSSSSRGFYNQSKTPIKLSALEQGSQTDKLVTIESLKSDNLKIKEIKKLVQKKKQSNLDSVSAAVSPNNSFYGKQGVQSSNQNSVDENFSLTCRNIDTSRIVNEQASKKTLSIIHENKKKYYSQYENPDNQPLQQNIKLQVPADSVQKKKKFILKKELLPLKYFIKDILSSVNGTRQAANTCGNFYQQKLKQKISSFNKSNYIFDDNLNDQQDNMNSILQNGSNQQGNTHFIENIQYANQQCNKK